jgi:lipopolysaccharide biosynthesis regulator YciM
MSNELLIAAIVVALAAAWFLGRRAGRRLASGDAQLPAHYLQGLNYLLNEQPDKAIEVFTKLIEVDSETVETHFALGNLFRRRGEVERAIRIHQNLIARPTLNKTQRTQALYELGLDYMRAGILSRAESVFQQLVDDDAWGAASLRQLIEIYQQEREWAKAIEFTRKLEQSTGQAHSAIVAQYHCELAEQALGAGQNDAAGEHISIALEADPKCVRASLLQGRRAAAIGEVDAAVTAYARVEHQDPEFLPEALGPVEQLYERMGQPDKALEFARGAYEKHGGIAALLTVADLLRRLHGDATASAFVADQLRKRPSVRGLHRLIELNLEHSRAEARENLIVLKELTSRLLANKPAYRCKQCGFNAKSLHWQCPGCKNWNSLKPIQSMEGETAA